VSGENVAGSVKSCIQLAEQVRSAYWSGRDEEDLGEAEEEVEGRPMSAPSRAEPMELDSNPSQAYCATPRRLSSSSVESAKIPPDEEDKKTLAAADSTVKGQRGWAPGYSCFAAFTRLFHTRLHLRSFPCTLPPPSPNARSRGAKTRRWLC
jgi:hypothetical protein